MRMKFPSGHMKQCINLCIFRFCAIHTLPKITLRYYHFFRPWFFALYMQRRSVVGFLILRVRASTDHELRTK